FDLLFCFNQSQAPGYERLARELFDWFRCPILEISVEPAVEFTIRRIRARTIDRLDAEERAFFHQALHEHTRREWRSPRIKTPADWSIAVLYDPKEEMPPSDVKTLRRF